MLRSFDLFAGIGGFRLAFENIFKKNKITFKTVGWSEIDKYCQKTYSANFDTKNNFFIDDIKKITAADKKFCNRNNYNSKKKSEYIKKNYLDSIY